MNKSLPKIKDKFDDEGNAEKLVEMGYPANAKAMTELIFWSCWPNDPVCRVTHPYIRSLSDEDLAPGMAEFLEFHLSKEQERMIEDAFSIFINDRGEKFRERVRSHMMTPEGRDLFTQEKYSLAAAATSSSGIERRPACLINFDDSRITVVFPNGSRKTVNWDAITRIMIRTTDEGTAAADVFWEIFDGGRTPTVVFAMGAEGEDQWLEAAQARLKNFNNDELIRAMATTMKAQFTVWKSK